MNCGSARPRSPLRVLLLCDARFVQFLHDFRKSIAILPRRIMGFEMTHVADVPDMVANAVIFDIAPLEFSSAHAFAPFDRFEHGTVRMSAASHVIHLAGTWRLEEFPKGGNEVVRVNIV